MHYKSSRLNRLRILGALALTLLAGASRAEDQPSVEMMKPVRALVDFMSKVPVDQHPSMLAPHGLCIIENFAPFLFCGPDARVAWEKGYRAHTAEEAESGLVAEFAPAHDFGVDGNRAYFSLPTTWTGSTHGRAFEERGAWAFVLERHGSEWRILAYGWAVSAFTQSDR